MRALSLWQPWGSAVACGIKTCETRSWAPPDSLIGQPLAIHVAKTKRGMDLIGWENLDFGEPLQAFFGANGPHWTVSMPYGVVVAVCRLVDVVQFPHEDAPPDPYGDFTPGRFGWMLDNIVALDPPIEARGRQGLWTWDAPPEIERLVA